MGDFGALGEADGVGADLGAEGASAAEPVVGVAEVAFAAVHDAVPVGGFVVVLDLRNLVMGRVEVVAVQVDRGGEAGVACPMSLDSLQFPPRDTLHFQIGETSESDVCKVHCQSMVFFSEFDILLNEADTCSVPSCLVPDLSSGIDFTR